MNERNYNRLPAGLIWFLIYHCIVVLIGLGYLIASIVILIKNQEYALVLVILVLSCWTAAMFYASVGMMRKSPRALRVGMICHLILAILSNLGLATTTCLGVLPFLGNGNHEARGWAQLFLLFALMWSPFALFSSWGYFYLDKLRKDLLA